MAKKKRADSLIWGIILIALGAVFLLHNIDIDIWDTVARLWPVVLIFWGIWKLYYGIKDLAEKSSSS